MVAAWPRRARQSGGEGGALGYLLAPILNMRVPQTGQVPSVAGLPFSRLVRHFRQ